MELKKILWVAAICFFSSAQAKNISWAEAVDLAQKNSLDLQAAELTFESTEALETAAESGFYPRVFGSLTGNRSGSKNADAADSYGAQLNLTQNIFAGWADLNRAHQASANTRQAAANLKLAKAKLSAQLKQAVAFSVYSFDYQKMTEDIVRRRDDNFKIVDLRFQGGRENKGSVLLSKAYLDEARYDFLTAGHDAEISREDLSRFLGLNPKEDVFFTETPPRISLLSKTPDFKNLSLRTPDVIALMEQAKASEAALSIAKANFVPTLDLSGSYGYIDTIFFPKQDRWSVGLTLSIPLFDGGRDYSAVKSASYKAQSFSKQAEALLQKSEVSLKQAYFDFIASVEKEKIDDDFRKASVVRAQIARSKYNNGLTSFDEWDRAESDLIARERSALSSRRDRIVKESLWEQAQGVGVF